MRLSEQIPVKTGYALLLQSIGAELDNFFKVYCGFAAEDRKNMNDYCTFKQYYVTSEIFIYSNT